MTESSALQKGPAHCHLAQDNAEVLAANQFYGVRGDHRIREHGDDE